MNMDIFNNNPSAREEYIASMKKWEEGYFRENRDSVILQLENELRKLGFEFEISQQIGEFLPVHKEIILPLVVKCYQETKRLGKYNEQDQLLEIFCSEGLEEVVPMLLEDYCSSITQDSTRYLIVDCLKKICSKHYAKEYLDIIANSELGTTRQMMISFVGELKVEEAIPVLIRLLEEEEVCEQAIYALGKYRREGFRPYFERFMKDENLRRRECARVALRKLDEWKKLGQESEENIQEILDMLDWHCSQEEQQKGLALAKKHRNLECFLGLGSERRPKSVWDNCALVLAERSDEELAPYLPELLGWLKDMNWPGAYCILERLGKYRDRDSFNKTLHQCIELANSENDKIWLHMLLKLQSCGEDRLAGNAKVDDIFQKIIKSVIDGWDPIDLRPHSPQDEYDLEITEVYQLIGKVKDSQELGEEIYRIFIRSFGEDVFRETIDDCVVIARFIYTAKLWPSLQNEWK